MVHQRTGQASAALSCIMPFAAVSPGRIAAVLARSASAPHELLRKLSCGPRPDRVLGRFSPNKEHCTNRAAFVVTDNARTRCLWGQRLRTRPFLQILSCGRRPQPFLPVRLPQPVGAP
eukprot:gene12353-biopygen16933